MHNYFKPFPCELKSAGLFIYGCFLLTFASQLQGYPECRQDYRNGNWQSYKCKFIIPCLQYTHTHHTHTHTLPTFSRWNKPFLRNTITRRITIFNWKQKKFFSIFLTTGHSHVLKLTDLPGRTHKCTCTKLAMIIFGSNCKQCKYC